MGTSRLLAGLCLAAALQGQAARADDGWTYDKVSMYYAAHQDDWQLFMNPSAFNDVAGTRTKTVFVHMTAGDAGSGIGTRGKRHPFYLARENGAEAAIRFMADTDGEPTDRTAIRARFNGHPIYRVSYRNTVSYFLRVPDGNPAGTGYQDTGFQSLQRLARGDTGTLTAVDGSTVYRGWADLVSTLRAILEFERGWAPAVQINVAELDQRLNPGDHSDHLMTAKAALDSAAGMTCARRVHYVDYASSRLPENLPPRQRDLESAVFAVTAAGIRALGHGSNWHWYDQAYVGRNYFRVEEGSGPCDMATTVSVAGR
jgi:hypothetical protein